MRRTAVSAAKVAIAAILAMGVPLAGPASIARAESAKPEGWHTFIGAGINLGFPGTIRIGYDDWEYGLLSNILGATKNFFFTENWYGGFGFGISLGHGPSGVGLQAATGAAYKLFWGFGFRFEINAQVNTYAALGTMGAIGLTYDF
jgi:hypothetical protein